MWPKLDVGVEIGDNSGLGYEKDKDKAMKV